MNDPPLSTRRLLLSRKNMGRHRLPDFLAELSAVLGTTVGADKVVELELADDLVARTARAITDARKLWATQGVPYSWSEQESALLSTMLTRLGTAVGDEEVLYVPPNADIVGAVRLSPLVVFPHIVDIARDREWVQVGDSTGGNGVSLDYDASGAEHGAPQPFELLVWGSRWLPLAMQAYQESRRAE